MNRLRDLLDNTWKKVPSVDIKTPLQVQSELGHLFHLLTSEALGYSQKEGILRKFVAMRMASRETPRVVVSTAPTTIDKIAKINSDNNIWERTVDPYVLFFGPQPLRKMLGEAQNHGAGNNHGQEQPEIVVPAALDPVA